MSSAPPPRTRPSPAVYRRRRLVLLLGVVVVIVAVVLVVLHPWSSASDTQSAPGGGSTTTTEGALPAATATPGADDAGATDAASIPAESSEPAVDGAVCTASQVLVKAVTDQSNYAADASPRLSLTLTNTGPNSCTINAGTSQQVFTITSGSDTYWTSTDCQSDPADQQILLEVDKTVTGSPLTWDRTRSSAETCGGGRESVPAGGASYYLTVTVAGFSSEQTQFLLN